MVHKRVQKLYGYSVHVVMYKHVFAPLVFKCVKILIHNFVDIYNVHYVKINNTILKDFNSSVEEINRLGILTSFNHCIDVIDLINCVT